MNCALVGTRSADLPGMTPPYPPPSSTSQHVHRRQFRSAEYSDTTVLSIKSECLDRMILFGEDSLRRALREYGAHHHTERPHQGLGNKLVAPIKPVGNGEIVETERLGGLLRSYDRAAA